MRPERKKLENKLDKLWRTVGKEDAVCEVCNCGEYSKRGKILKTGQLHPHHVVGRRNKILRWDLRNRCWICPAHHTSGKFSAHNDPMWFMDWFEYYRPDDYIYVYENRNKIAKYTLDDLREIIDDLSKM